jgi:Novel toxin 10/HNH endonuclease
VWQNGTGYVGFNEHSRAGVVLFNTEWRFMLCFARAGAWKKTLLGVFLLFAGSLALGNVPQGHDWTKEKVPARVENALGGNFMSVDPVLTDNNTGASFNRYVYAINNPYKYIDPDGRAIETPWDAANVAMGVVSLTKNLAIGNYAGAAVDAVGVLVDSAATVAPGLPGGAATAINAVRVSEVVVKGAKDGLRAGKPHTQAAKKAALAQNKAANGGKAICPKCSKEMSDPKQSKSGEPKDMKQAEGDHIDAKSQGGDGATVKDMRNIETICAGCNNVKSDN